MLPTGYDKDETYRLAEQDAGEEGLEEGREEGRGEVLEEAVDSAIKSCFEEGILADLLQQHMGEVKGMVLAEFYEDEMMRWLEEDAGEVGARIAHEIGVMMTRCDSINLGYSTVEEEAAYMGLTPEEFLQKVSRLSLFLHNPKRFAEKFGKDAWRDLK